jgi:CBS-domain-containing membrane protein
MDYFKKMKGVTKSPPQVAIKEMVWSWIGAFAGIAAIAVLYYFFLDDTDLKLLIGSFGASAVLVFGAIRSPLAQPRNLMGGHMLSAVVGVTMYKLLPGHLCLASALSVSTAIFVMHATKTLHPPGGATALIAVIGSPAIHHLGYFYALMPVGLGAVIMLAVALAVNNIPSHRRYPEFWF